MNSKIFTKVLYVISVVLLCTTDFAFALDSAPEINLAIKAIAVKLLLAMMGVVVFSILISVGLSLYNRFFVSSHVKDFNLSKDSLRSPYDKDDAVAMFITKNRLK